MSIHDMDISNDSGAAVRADINLALVALASNFSGATDPNGTYATSYQFWADTSAGVMKIRNAADSAWITLFNLATGGDAQGADIASAAALPVLADGKFNDVTGTTSITSIDTIGIGSLKILQFDDALTLTHHATNLILPDGENIQVAAGDIIAFYEYAVGDWRMISNSRPRSKETIAIAASDETSDLSTGTAKATFRMPYAFLLSDIRCSVTTAPTGSTLTIDVNESGSTILSTKLTIDASEKTSTTAATQRVVSDGALADDAEITIDIDQIGSSVAGAGLKVYLIGRRV